MCGIAGIAGIGGAANVNAMMAAQAHRGPDGDGLWTDEEAHVAFGHRRLAIIDLTEAGRQPMVDASGRFIVTFNGELYNYRALRQELEHAGETFRTHTDTEVLLTAWRLWGLSSLDRLRGMFAFAIWDREERTLFAARDRFGIKPLYYAERPGGLAFASEITALMASGLVEKRADTTAIIDYLRHGAIRQPRTILDGVRSLLPGHWLRWQEGQLDIRPWWNIVERTRSLRSALRDVSRKEATAELRRRLDDAARHHLVADVEVGAFLSGGIDSTAVIGLMNQASNRPVRSFAVGFEGRHTHLSELKWARLAAERLGTRHSEIVLGASDIESAADSLTAALDQPSVDGTNTWFVSRAASRELCVALTGLGGDELFAGYPHFRRIALAQRLAPTGLNNSRVLEWASRLPARARVHLATLRADEIERLVSLRRISDNAALNAMSGQALEAAHGDDPRHLADGILNQELDTTARVSAWELSVYLRDTLLRDGDAMSMAHSLEVRPVLLDHPLAEFAFALPGRLKHSLTQGKTLFIDSVRDLLPDDIVHRRKMGFELPMTDWLKTSLRTRAEEAFTSAEARTLLSAAYRREVLASLAAAPGSPPVTHRTWALFTLLRYLAHHRIALGDTRSRSVA